MDAKRPAAIVPHFAVVVHQTRRSQLLPFLAKSPARRVSVSDIDAFGEYFRIRT
jgi:hypothetical protein